ncbi:MAG: NusG domain II-containing protein [Spirochaetales bacterium]|nr:NusG domain II-containing protein [Spirochaetales bacterium]
MKYLKLADGIILFFSLALIVSVSAFALAQNSGKKQVYIKGVDGEYLYSLDRDARISINGPLGETIIIIEDGLVRVADSPCRDKLCVLDGPFGKAGEWTACLPNKVFVSIRGVKEEESPVDDVAY